MTIIGDSITFFRARWAERFAAADADSCVIRRQTGTTLDTDTGLEVPTYLDPHPYQGACIWRPGAASDTEAGEQQVELRGGILLVPYDTDGIEPDDEVVMTSTHDADLNGKVLVVRNVPTDTYVTVRRIFAEDNQGG